MRIIWHCRSQGRLLAGHGAYSATYLTSSVLGPTWNVHWNHP